MCGIFNINYKLFLKYFFLSEKYGNPNFAMNFDKIKKLAHFFQNKVYGINISVLHRQGEILLSNYNFI